MTFAKFQPVALLGQGGMADVFLAKQSGPAGFHKFVVLKRLRPGVDANEELVRMFFDESRLAARLNHPNIVSTFEVGEDDRGRFLAMEYLEGQSLAAVLKHGKRKHAPLRLAEHVFVLGEVLAALEYAHTLADFDGRPLYVVHRDVSPQNVFVTYAGVTKLVDFGVAKAADAQVTTRAGMLKGKLSYMAPEQATGGAIDGRADVYAVGVMLWEALTKRRFREGATDVVRLTQVLNGEAAVRPSSLVPEVAPELEAVCLRALENAPDDRYQSATEMHEALAVAAERVGLRSSARELAQHVGELFINERAELKSAVEKSLRALNERVSDPGSLVLAELPRAVSHTVSTGPSRPTLRGTHGGWAESAASGRSRRPWLAAALVAFIVATASAVVVVRAHHDEPESSSASASVRATALTPPSSPTASVSVPATPATVDLRVHVTPTDARVSLDGSGLATPNGAWPRDGAQHLLKVEAAGYRSKTIVVTFDRDISIDVSLEADAHRLGLPGVMPHHHGPAAASGNPASPPQVSPTGITELAPPTTRPGSARVTAPIDSTF